MPQTDLVTLVNEQDEVIGTMDKLEAHLGKGKLHRAISVFLFRKNENGAVELLIQKRSARKIVGAGQWANTCCGNVWPDESYLECAKRRLKHELGIDSTRVELSDSHTFRYQVRCNEKYSENEIDHIFVGWYDGEVNLNREEVAEYRWKKWSEFLQIFQTDSSWAPWTKIMIQNQAINNKVSSYIEKG